MRSFSINIQGRVKNFNLPKNQPLVPLFEAIVNAIHAIGERKSTDPSFGGQIIIRILRDEQLVLDGTGELPQIQSFEIIDNGIGFNIASFMESDSTYKAKIGGKGVGRFSWLIAFEKAEIESAYSEKDGYVKRAFDFSLSNSGINDTLTDCTGYNDNQTTVRLLNYLKPYADSVPKRGITIAMRIIQHCLVYFISDDSDSSNPVNQLYKYVSQLKTNTKKDKDGRIIRVGQNTKFYLYAVCDITTTLEQILDFHDFSQTPDKLGYYKYNDKMNAYIEILSYDKIINDAKKRNRIIENAEIIRIVYPYTTQIFS